MDSHALVSKLDAALARRKRLLNDPAFEGVRLFHGRADGLEGLVVEKWADVLIVQLHEGLPLPSPDELRPHMLAWRERFDARAVYLKQFVRNRGSGDAEVENAHRDATPWIGEQVDEEITVREGDCAFLIHPFDGFSVGLFLEHRDNRRRVVELSAGRRVMNAYAYTCGFSIAAARGGAASIASVDLSKRYLEWGKRNFAANDLSIEPHRFYASDTFEYLKRARRQGMMFDLMILDPPTFSRRRRPASVFKLSVELPRLVEETVERLDRDGVLFLATNDRQIRPEKMEDAIAQAAGRRRFKVMERPSLPSDFAGDHAYAKSLFVQFD